jgi:CheY-like chemotaxis protein
VAGDAENGLAAGDYVVLAVADSGCGIDADMIEQVMEPFFTTKDVGKGTGLGLSMVYGFAKQSGGAFRIDSKIGVGTRAAIWLPRAPDVAAALPERADRRGAVADMESMRVLLVDDHEGVRTTTAALLRDVGHQVIEAADGPEVLAMLADDPGCCDLLISDYAMPHVSGAEVIRQARALRPGLPAVIITGYADAQSISRRPEDVLVLSKPFTPDQLKLAIQAASQRQGDQPEKLKAAS